MPAFTSQPRIIKRIREQAVEMLKLRARGVTDSLLDEDGSFWSDDNVTGGDLIAFYADLEQRGVLEFLRLVGPKHAADLDRQYDRELGKLLESA